MLSERRFLRGWLLSVLVATLALAWLHSRWALETFAGAPEVVPSPVIRSGSANGSAALLTCCVQPGQVDSMASWEVRIAPAVDYVIQFSVDNRGPGDVSPLIVDLAGDGYDSMEQEFHVDVPRGASNSVVTRVLRSGSPPSRVWLRVFHSANAAVLVKDVSVRPLHRTYRAAKLAVTCLFGLAALGVAVVAWRSITLRDRLKRLLSNVRGSAWLWLAALALGIAALGNAMLGPPLVFADEFLYAQATLKLGRWWSDGVLAAHASDLPNRLFFAVYSIAATGHAPYAVARALNMLALALGLWALWYAARALRDVRSGIAVAAAYGLGVLSTYTAYFMPDALFAAMFMLACIALSIALATGGWRMAAIAGAACAAETFIKPHGWAVALAFAISSVLFVARVEREGKRRAWRTLALLVTVFAVTWSVLQLALPDVPGRRTFFGATYGGLARGLLATAAQPGTYGGVLRLLGAHLVVVGSLLAPMLIYAVGTLLRRPPLPSDPSERVAHVLAGVSVLSLVVLIALTSLFTASVVGLGSAEVANRLHGRYYTFAIPLLVLATVASHSARQFLQRNVAWILPAWGLACMACILVLPRFLWSFVDSPELFFGWGAPKATFAAFGALGSLAALLSWRRRDAIPHAALAAYVVTSLASGMVIRDLQVSVGELPENRAGKVSAALAAQRHVPILLAAESSSVGLYRIGASDPRNARFIKRAELGRDIESGAARGAVVVGNRQYIAGLPIAPKAEFDDWVVGVVESDGAGGQDTVDASRMAWTPLKLRFSRAQESGKASGLHRAESWGAWSSGPRISIPLPPEVIGRVRVTLRGHAVTSNVGRTLVMRIGPEAKTFTLGATPTDIALPFDVAGAERTLVIDGYLQLSPERAKVPNETRDLGIGLWSIEFTPDASAR